MLFLFEEAVTGLLLQGAVMEGSCPALCGGGRLLALPIKSKRVWGPFSFFQLQFEGFQLA